MLSAIDTQGFLLATANIAPPLDNDLPGVEEFLLWEAAKQVIIQFNGERDPTVLAPFILKRLERELAQGRRVALELGYREADAA